MKIKNFTIEIAVHNEKIIYWHQVNGEQQNVSGKNALLKKIKQQYCIGLRCEKIYQDYGWNTNLYNYHESIILAKAAFKNVLFLASTIDLDRMRKRDRIWLLHVVADTYALSSMLSINQFNFPYFRREKNPEYLKTALSWFRKSFELVKSGEQDVEKFLKDLDSVIKINPYTDEISNLLEQFKILQSTCLEIKSSIPEINTEEWFDFEELEITENLKFEKNSNFFKTIYLFFQANSDSKLLGFDDEKISKFSLKNNNSNLE